MEGWQLTQMQSLPLDVKIQKSLQRIKEWYEAFDGLVYVSFSGGKDSTVLLHLVRSLYPEVPAVFIDTGLEYPEIRAFVKTIDNVIWIKPKYHFTEILEKYGYPIINKEQSSFLYEYRNTNSEKLKNIRWNGNKSGYGKISNKWRFLVDAPFKISDKCCDYLKKKPASRYEKQSGRKPFIGVMASESEKRVQDYLKYGCNAFETKRPISRPMGFWTEQDVLEYIDKIKLSYASIYGDIIKQNDCFIVTGEPRTGCVFCAFGQHLEKEPNKFQRLKLTHPKLWDYCINKLGFKQVLEYMNIPYE